MIQCINDISTEVSKLYFLPAKAGDCFLLRIGFKCILIDAGYKSTFCDFLKPLLLNLSREGCVISLMVVTHMDQDHIEGAIEFLKENGDYNNPAIIKVEEIWYNGFFNTLIPMLKDKYSENISQECINEYREAIGNLKKLGHGEDGPISAKLGASFEQTCYENHYALNRSCQDGKAVVGSQLFIGEILINVLFPDEVILQKIGKFLDREMIGMFGNNYRFTKNKFFAEFFELFLEINGADSHGETKLEGIAASSDARIEEWINTTSMAQMNLVNRASIVIEVMYKGRKLLFTGDSEGSDWIEQASSYYDLIKFSHHGTSKPNMALLDNIKADKVLISSNGLHNRPEKDFLARCLKNHYKEMYFNYRIPEADILLSVQNKYGCKCYFEIKEIDLTAHTLGEKTVV